MTTHCNLGVGCEQAGVCYAAVHGQPGRCGMPVAPLTKTIRVTVREELVEYQDIEFEVPIAFDPTNEEALGEVAELAFTEGNYQYLVGTNEIEVVEREFFTARIQPNTSAAT